MLPGSPEPVHTAAQVVHMANEIGFSLIIKAVAGGGGLGMSVVRRLPELVPAFRATRAAAQAVFGDGRVYVEQFCEQARHVEVQVLGDQHGQLVHLGERDCSVQRRHQKLVEESPALGLAPELTQRIIEAAVRGARAVDYTGVDTFEFLVIGGWRIPPDYDSLLAKVLAWAPDRDQALHRLDRALTEFRIAGRGVHTTVEVMRKILANPTFRAGRHTTSFLDEVRRSNAHQDPVDGRVAHPGNLSRQHGILVP